MVKDIFRWLGFILLTFLIFAEIITVSMVAQTLFSGNLGKVIVGIVLIAYILFFSYTSSLMAFWVSFWAFSKRWGIFLVLIEIFGFLASLVLIPLIVNAGWAGVAFLLPIILYAIAIYRKVVSIYSLQ